MFKPAETDFIEMVKEKIAGNAFMHFLGVRIIEIGTGTIEAELSLQKHHLQQVDFVHGGVTATLADIVAGFSAFTLIKHGQGMVTVDLRVSYLNPAKGDKLYARGYVIKAGQKLFFTEAELWTINEERKLMVAKASATMAVVNPEDITRA